MQMKSEEDYISQIKDQSAKLPAGKTFMEFVLTTGVYDMAESNGFENVRKRTKK